VGRYHVLQTLRHAHILDDEFWENAIFYCIHFKVGSRVNSGSIVSDYGLDDRGSIPGRGREFFL
jgi:hypothetical protein